MKKLNKLLFIFVLGFIPIQIFAWQGMPTPALHVDGRYLKDPTGKNVLLHGYMQPSTSYFNGGTNVNYTDPTNYNPSDVAGELNYFKKVAELMTHTGSLYGKSNGWYCSYVRYLDGRVGWDNGTLTDAAKFNRWITNECVPYINYCKSMGLYVVICGQPAWVNADDDGSKNMTAQYKQNLITWWTTVANASGIKNADNVMFEICNEPVGIESSLGNGDWGWGTNAHNQAFQTYMQDIVNAIRNTGANNVTWVSSLCWSTTMSQFVDYPISGSNIGYLGHWYPYGDTNMSNFTNNFNSNWKPCTDKYPLLITECAWNVNDSYGLINGTTEGFGNTTKSLFDTQGNVSWVIGMTGDDIGHLSSGWANITYPTSSCGQAAFGWWPTYTSSAPTSGSCTPTTITPYLQVNSGTWQQTSSVTVNSGDKVIFGPQPSSGGSWSWSGGGTSGISREQTIYPTNSITATATYTNSSGCTSTQTFTVNVNGSSSGYVSIQNKATGLYIDGMGRTTDGSNAGQWSSSTSNNQQWVEETSGSYVKFKNRATGLYLDGMGRTSNGSLVGLSSNSSGNNQQWVIADIGSYKSIKNSASGLYIDGMSWNTNGSDLGLWSNSGSDAQQWTITSLKSAKANSEELSIVDEKNKGILLFPNPFTDETNLRIDNPEQVTRIVVLDMLGRQVEVIDHAAVKNLQAIGASLKAGIYVVQVCSGGKTQSFKVFKK
jgi:Cellulase (glycosyl hydrolase family 5)/Ricin-type beta-trefoil lectin domain-like/Secretion system C-terminal sorting domain